jgi:hypothetical protein
MISLKTKKYTKYIGKKDVPVAQAMAKMLYNFCKGKNNAMTNNDIIANFNKRGVILTQPEVRQFINFICINYLPNLVGTGNGYYITDEEDELRHAMRSLVSRARENTMRAEILHNYINNYPPTNGQLRIDFGHMPDYFRIIGQLKIEF